MYDATNNRCTNLISYMMCCRTLPLLQKAQQKLRNNDSKEGDRHQNVQFWAPPLLLTATMGQSNHCCKILTIVDISTVASIVATCNNGLHHCC